ncbi:MAG: UDP-N-acetylmuramate dehydrogenase [Flavobacteriaceae bacterium]|nr:UDP-N-acetylmuramate dehydrogenase [Flavobacteriaceae bacterium]
MKILRNISLKQYNTFGIDVIAKQFVEIASPEELKQIIALYPDCFIIGGGSNMLLTKPIEKLVVKLNLKGIEETPCKTADNTVYVSALAGENWHDFVLWCISKNYGGLENLSLIPGSVGACPIQNIGAYGVEVKDSITKVEVLEVATSKIVSLTNADCQFGYRNSIFKSPLKDKYIILKVTFKLTTKQHQLHLDYGAVKLELGGLSSPSLSQISDAIIKIRASKLPNPKDIGNSGSFFKNPIISQKHFYKLLKSHPNMPFYKMEENLIKIPAGWLIEQCGLKGKRFGDAGVHNKQALVLVNYGKATGKDILKLAQLIQNSVKSAFKIDLQTEVNIFS